MERQLDIFGVIVLSIITAVGGGVTRDIILGNTPPIIFRDPYYVMLAFLISLVLLLVVFLLKNFSDLFIGYMKIINICDAMGLGIFSVLGATAAIKSGFEANIFLCTFIGVITGIGGGIIRDVLVCRIPIVLRRDLYAISSIIGTLAFCYIRLVLPESIAMLACAALICIVRLLSIKFKLTLPVTSMTK